MLPENAVGPRIKRISNAPYQCTTELHPISEVANPEKKVPLEWITPDGCNVTDDFIRYCSPLIRGETALRYENGLPRFAKLKQVFAE